MTWLSDSALSRLRDVGNRPDFSATKYEVVEKLGEGVPGGSHPDGNGECNGRENKRRSPHRGAVDASHGREFVNNENEKQDAEAGDGSSGGRQSDAGPRKAPEGSGDETHSSDQDETLVCIGLPPSAPGSVNDDGEGDDAD